MYSGVARIQQSFILLSTVLKPNNKSDSRRLLETITRYLLARLIIGRRVGHGTRYAPGTEKGCCVGGTWRHSETPEAEWSSRVAAVFWGCYEYNKKNNQRSVLTLPLPPRTEEHYYRMIHVTTAVLVVLLLYRPSDKKEPPTRNSQPDVSGQVRSSEAVILKLS